MTQKKDPPKPFDHEGHIYRQDYAPGICALLRALSKMDAETVLAELRSENARRGDFPKRLKMLLAENLRRAAAEAFELGSLGELSQLAQEETACYPKMPGASKEAPAKKELTP